MRMKPNCAAKADGHLSDEEIELKMLEATEVVGSYLAIQSDMEQPHAAVGALRVSAACLLDATDPDTTARVLREMARAFRHTTRPVLH